MLIAYFFVQNVELDKVTAEMGAACLKEAEQYDSVMRMFMTVHIIAFFACVYREIFSSKTTIFAQFIRIMEIFSAAAYLYSILFTYELMIVIIFRDFKHEKPEGTTLKFEKFIADSCPSEHVQEFRGTVMEWMVTELVVFSCYLLTFVILMIKSRFAPVGIDNSY